MHIYMHGSTDKLRQALALALGGKAKGKKPQYCRSIIFCPIIFNFVGNTINTQKFF